MGCRSPLLTEKGIAVLRFTGNAVAYGHDIAGFVHGHSQFRFVLAQPGVHAFGLVQRRLYQADRLDTASNNDGHLIDQHALGRDTDHLKTGGTATVVPPTEIDRPARTAQSRAMLLPVSPSGVPHPMITSSTSSVASHEDKEKKQDNHQ